MNLLADPDRVAYARSRTAAARFFLRIGQAKQIDERYDRETLPLFPLVLIMAADGTLTREAARLAEKVQA